ncbi:MAG: PCRF domain-containing protein, partial [Candidatus Kapaibacterium sp.]
MDAKQREVDEREHDSQMPGFWDDNQAAQKVMQEIAERKEWISVWTALKSRCEDVAALIELSEESDDPSTEPE